MNTSDFAYVFECVAVEVIPNPYNPVRADWGLERGEELVPHSHVVPGF
jgi:hypothetical protein